MISSSVCSSVQLSTAWSQSGRSGQSVTSPAVKDTPSAPGWSNWSRSSGAALVLRPSRGRNARSGNAGRKPMKTEEGRGGDGVNWEKIQRDSQVGCVNGMNLHVTFIHMEFIISIPAAEACLKSVISPAGCRMQPWTSWTDCTKPCGGGIQERFMVAKKRAKGSCKDRKEIRACNVHPC